MSLFNLSTASSYATMAKEDKSAFHKRFAQVRNFPGVEAQAGDLDAMMVEYSRFAVFARGQLEKLQTAGTVSNVDIATASRRLWAGNDTRDFPVLSRCARAWLCLRTSSAEIERRFNYVPQLLTSDRQGMSTDNISKHLLLFANKGSVKWL